MGMFPPNSLTAAGVTQNDGPEGQGDASGFKDGHFGYLCEISGEDVTIFYHNS